MRVVSQAGPRFHAFAFCRCGRGDNIASPVVAERRDRRLPIDHFMAYGALAALCQAVLFAGCRNSRNYARVMNVLRCNGASIAAGVAGCIAVIVVAMRGRREPLTAFVFALMPMLGRIAAPLVRGNMGGKDDRFINADRNGATSVSEEFIAAGAAPVFDFSFSICAAIGVDGSMVR